jgi:hypothetical protein
VLSWRLDFCGWFLGLERAYTFDSSQLGFCIWFLVLTRAQLEIRFLGSDSVPHACLAGDCIFAVGFWASRVLIHLTLHN